MILTHDEFESGELVPTWTAVDEDSVTTFREAHEKMKSEGWVVDYHRTPISSDRPVEVSANVAVFRVISHCFPIGQLPGRICPSSARRGSYNDFARVQ